MIGEQAEGFREKRIAGEDGHGFPKFDMGGRQAAAQRTIVHGGEVIMDQRVGMEALNGDGRWKRVNSGAVEIRSEEDQRGPEALPACPQAVVHGLMEVGRLSLWRWKEAYQGLLDGVQVVGWEWR